MQLKVHPLFFALALVLMLCGQALNFAWTFAALVLHETAHALMARARGFSINKLVLLPFGAMMSTQESFDRTSSVLVGLAGPIFNLLLALMLTGVWWIFPAAYGVTLPFFYANISLGLFNLLPVYPLDGSRVVLGLSKNRLKAIKGLQAAGIVCSVILMALFIVSAFFKINFSLGIMAVFLFYGAAFGTREEAYMSVLSNSVKNYSNGVELKRVRIAGGTPIARLFHHVSPQSITTFEIVDRNGSIVKTLDEDDLRKLAINEKLSSPVLPSVGSENAKKRKKKSRSL